VSGGGGARGAPPPPLQPLTSVDFQSDHGVRGAQTLADDASTARGQARTVDVAVRDRPEIGVRTRSDRDALGPEAVRQRETGGPALPGGSGRPGHPAEGGEKRRAAECGPCLENSSTCEGTVHRSSFRQMLCRPFHLNTEQAPPQCLAELRRDIGFRTKCTGFPFSLISNVFRASGVDVPPRR